MGTEHTILVVEDEAPLLKAIQDKLKLSGYATVGARTAKQALAYLEDVDNIVAI